MTDKEKLNLIEDILVNHYEDPVEELSKNELLEILDAIEEVFDGVPVEKRIFG